MDPFAGNETNLEAKNKLDAIIAAADPAAVVTESTTARTLGLADANKYIRLTNAASCTITLPQQATVAWADNTEISFRIANTGIPTITLGSGVTLNNSAALASLAQHATFALKRVGSNVWDLI